MKAGFAIASSAALLAAAPHLAHGQTPIAGTEAIFRDTRSFNDVGVAQGDRIQFGANIDRDALNTTLGLFRSNGTQVGVDFPCGPTLVNPLGCSSSVAYNSALVGQPLTIRFTNGGTASSVGVTLNAGALVAMPFADSVSFSGTGITPTLNWTIPTGVTPDFVGLTIYDKDNSRGISTDPRANVIYSAILPGNTTSFTLPGVLDSGAATGQQLQPGGDYTIQLRLIDTVPGTSLVVGGGASGIIRQSSAYFAFSPIIGQSVPGAVFLPTVDRSVAGTATYRFNIGGVGPTAVTFIDPEVAIGYVYRTGAGDPNFRSVLLPNVGDGVFSLRYTLGGQSFLQTLLAGQTFQFGGAGVSEFTVEGIEESAGLDPLDGTAFITGLTFTSEGRFTGTMTPLVSAVPEPSTYALFACGALLLAGAMRRRRASGVEQTPA